jgi:hypothetical protein
MLRKFNRQRNRDAPNPLHSRTTRMCYLTFLYCEAAFNSSRLAPPARVANWSLTSLQQRLVKNGGRLIRHARYYWLLLAQSHLTRRSFGSSCAQAMLPAPGG